MINIKVQKTREDAIIPEYAHEEDAGMDVYSTKDYLLLPKHRTLIGTGLKIEIPKGYEMQIRPKSGLALREGITVLNTPGTIDSSYTGEAGIILINHSSKPYKIEKGQKIAQIIFNKIERVKFVETDKIKTTNRGNNGFGSTGLKNEKISHDFSMQKTKKRFLHHKKPNKTVFRTNFSRIYS